MKRIAVALLLIAAAAHADRWQPSDRLRVANLNDPQISPDGKSVAVAFGFRFRVWNLISGKEVMRFGHHDGVGDDLRGKGPFARPDRRGCAKAWREDDRFQVRHVRIEQQHARQDAKDAAGRESLGDRLGGTKARL